MNAMQPPQSVEEIKAGLETTEKGGVRQSIRNCLTVFQRDPLLSGDVYKRQIADTSGDFRRLYDRNFAENRPETIH